METNGFTAIYDKVIVSSKPTSELSSAYVEAKGTTRDGVSAPSNLLAVGQCGLNTVSKNVSVYRVSVLLAGALT